MESARFSLPGDRENVVKLLADHHTVCKFGADQDGQDNWKLVRHNIKDIYKAALKKGELDAISEPVASEAEVGIEARLAALRSPPS